MIQSVDITEILSRFWQKFRESNVFTKEVSKKLISRKKMSVRENFSFFHTVVRKIAENFFVRHFSLYVSFTKFF